jgi:hypothetical protein
VAHATIDPKNSARLSDRRRQSVGEITRFLVQVVAHVDDPAHGFHDVVLWNEGDRSCRSGPRHKRNQAELVRLLLERSRHGPHVDDDAIDGVIHTKGFSARRLGRHQRGSSGPMSKIRRISRVLAAQAL